MMNQTMYEQQAWSADSTAPLEPVETIPIELEGLIEEILESPSGFEEPGKIDATMVEMGGNEIKLSESKYYYLSLRDVRFERLESWNPMFIGVNRTDMYEEPDGEVIRTLIFTNVVEVSSEECIDGWYKIRWESEEGYVQADALRTRQEMLDANQYQYAQAMTCEAGGVGIAEMARCGEVMINRTITTYWEFANQRNLTSVLSAPGQYPGTWQKIQNGITPSNKALAIAEAMLVGSCDIEKYFSLEEYAELKEEEKLMLAEYKDQFPDNTYWQTGFYPPWAVIVIYESYCGNGYWHYYSIPKYE